MIVPSLENGSLSGVIVAVLIAVVICAAVYCLRVQLRWRGRHDGPRTALSYYSKKFRTESGRNTTVLPLKFHTFIRRDVIDIFNQQRVRRDQFAVLFFIDENLDLNTNTNTSVSFYTTEADNQHCLTHATYPFWPIDPQNFGNFMVARPEPSLSQHAEEILLEHFPKVWDVYQQREDRSPKYVILYSWTMPCAKKCTPKLISITFSNKYTESTKFIVVYTIHWCKEDISDIEHSKKSLRDLGVIVERVDYDKKLFPSFEEQRRASVTPPPMPEADEPSR